MSKAAVLPGLSQDFEIWDVDVPPPLPGEVVVRLGATGICHSDFSLRDGTLPFITAWPAILGHEGAGIVEEIGKDVTAVSTGDHVVLSFKPACRTCWFCTHGQPFLCSLSSGNPAARSTADGRTAWPRGLATFEERTVVSQHSVVKIADDVPLDAAALLGCGVMTGFGAAANTAKIAPGDTVVVIGCGGVGLNAVQGAAYRRAGRVIAVDLLSSKAELAKSFGATDAIGSKDTDAVSAVKEMTDGRGADCVLDASGVQQAVDLAFAMTRVGGTTVLVGIGGVDVQFPIPTSQLILYNRTVAGSMYGSCDFPRDIALLVDLYQKGSLKLDELITHRLPIERIQEGFDTMATGNVARSVVTF